MNKRIVLTLLMAFIIAFGLQSCERLKKKIEHRERRLQYFQHTIDSARKELGKKQDSLRKQFKQ